MNILYINYYYFGANEGWNDRLFQDKNRAIYSFG